MSPAIFHHPHRVTYAECTLGNHVYYSRYLDMLENARGEFFRHLGFPLLALEQQDAIFPAVECALQYQAPARYDQSLDIALWLEGLWGVRLLFRYRIADLQSGERVLDASSLHACTSRIEKPKRIPPPLAAALQAYLHSRFPLPDPPSPSRLPQSASRAAPE